MAEPLVALRGIRKSFPGIVANDGVDFDIFAGEIHALLGEKTGIMPVIDTAIAHRNPGHPKIGGGIVRAPLLCFEKALARFAERYDL